MKLLALLTIGAACALLTPPAGYSSCSGGSCGAVASPAFQLVPAYTYAAPVLVYHWETSVNGLPHVRLYLGDGNTHVGAADLSRGVYYQVWKRNGKWRFGPEVPLAQAPVPIPAAMRVSLLGPCGIGGCGCGCLYEPQKCTCAAKKK